MTRIKRIKMVLKYFRATVQVLVCCRLGKIYIKLNGNDTPPRILLRCVIRGTEDIMDALKAFELNEEYEKFKQVYDESQEVNRET